MLGPWRSRGRLPHLILKQSKFESCWKNKCKQKEDRVKIRYMKRFTFIYWFLQYTCITESFLKHTNHKNIFKRREHSICFENIFILFKRRIQQSYFLRKINFSIRSGMRTKPKPSPSRRRRARFIRRRKRCCFVCVSCRSQKSSLGTSWHHDWAKSKKKLIQNVVFGLCRSVEKVQRISS